MTVRIRGQPVDVLVLWTAAIEMNGEKGNIQNVTMLVIGRINRLRLAALVSIVGASDC
ncbi:MAG TPA: hypothetical protein VGM98_06360 [Schlesneria sp.]|jgi:hypothetical protein